MTSFQGYPRDSIGGIKKARFQDRGQQQAFDSMVQAIERLAGKVGGGRDRAIRVGEMIDMGIIDKNMRFTGGSSGGNIIVPPGPSPGPDPIDPPIKPVNFKATGLFTSVMLQWDMATYRGHSHSQIFRSTTPIFGEAVKIADTPSSTYGDAVGGGLTYYYWVKFVNKKGETGPTSDMRKAVTQVDPKIILDTISGRINRSHLGKWLREPIGKIPKIEIDLENVSNASTRNTITVTRTQEALWKNEEETIKAHARITEESITRANEDGALALYMREMEATFSDDIATTNAKITQMDGVWANRVEAIAGRITNISVEFGNEQGKSTAMIRQESVTRAAENYALAQRVTSSEAGIKRNEGGVREAKAKTDTLEQNIANDKDGIISQTIKKHQVEWKDDKGKTHKAALEQIAKVSADTEGKFSTQWGVKSTIKDIVRGVGFSQDSKGRAQFVVNADTFAVMQHYREDDDPKPVDPKPPQAVFVVEDGKVVMNKAVMREAWIKTLAAGEITAERINALNVTADKIQGGEIWCGSSSVNPAFKVDRAGKMTAQDADVKGTIHATKLILGTGVTVNYSAISGTKPPSNADRTNYNDTRVNNNDITKSQLTSGGKIFPNQNNLNIHSSNYVPNSSGWAIDNDGNVEFSNGVFRGAIFANKIVGDVLSGRALNIDTRWKEVGATARGAWVTVASIRCRPSVSGIFHIESLPMVTYYVYNTVFKINVGARVLRNGTVIASYYEQQSFRASDGTNFNFNSPAVSDYRSVGTDQTYHVQVYVPGNSGSRGTFRSRCYTSTTLALLVPPGSSFP